MICGVMGTMQTRGSFTVDARFRGPPHSANGGYCCGSLARILGEPLEVTLKSPPPLHTRLEWADGELRHGDTVVATAKLSELDLDLPAPISVDEARAREKHYLGHRGHPFPECFVCGPKRAPGDGLRIFPGRSAPEEPVAASWIPHHSLAGASGVVRSEFLWSALDCPGYFGVATEPVRALLGRMTGHVKRSVAAGDPCVVMAWPLGRDGRKCYAGSAIWSEHGELLASSRQTWIELL